MEDINKKIDGYAQDLLDIGKRNNLINFKDSKTSTVEIIYPTPELLFPKVNGSTTLEVFDPNIKGDEDDDEEEEDSSEISAEEPQLSEDKEKFIEQYSSKLKKQCQVLAYNESKNPILAVRRIAKKAQQFIEEAGVNVAYMAFGFIHWKESDESLDSMLAPVLLVPVQLGQESAVDPFTIKSTGDDVVVNPTFAYKLSVDYGITLPEYEDEGLNEYLSKVNEIVKKLGWPVSNECKMGVFSFLKINMYNDLKANKDDILANPIVKQIMGEPVEMEDAEPDEGDDSLDPLVDLCTVVDADSSQIEAIEMAKSGKSFVLQGPPGTGKSQTITNIIAQSLNDGKKVLFVSEKMAALNVVYNNLKKVGLGEFCLQLHSHKANKKYAIQDICQTLMAKRTALSQSADAEIAIKEKAERQLNEYERELHEVRPVIGKSLYQLYESFSKYRSAPSVETPLDDLNKRGEDYLHEVEGQFDQYAQFVNSIGYDYHLNPWYGYIKQDSSYQSKLEVKANITSLQGLLESLIPLLEEISGKCSLKCDTIAQSRLLMSFFKFALDSKILTPKLLDKGFFQTAYSVCPRLQPLSQSIISMENELSKNYEEDVQSLDGKKMLRSLTKRFNGFFCRLFNSEYKKLIADLREFRKDGGKPSYKAAVKDADTLSKLQIAKADFASIEKKVSGYFGPAYKGIYTDWDYLNSQLAFLKGLFDQGMQFGLLAKKEDLSSELDDISIYEARLESILSSTEGKSVEHVESYFDSGVADVINLSCSKLLEKMSDCLSDFGKLDNYCAFRSLLYRIEQNKARAFLDLAISKDVPPLELSPCFARQFYFQWIDSIISSSELLSSFNKVSQDNEVSIFKEKDKEQFAINRAKIRSKLSQMRPTTEMVAAGSELSILLREGEKKKRQKSIRQLLLETGDLVQCIKPCFLMSPLSVSTFLAKGSVNFDLVVFDEASQIFPWDAIGAIYRGKQLIVVGDKKQMPPTNFFSASPDLDDVDEEIGDVKDFESILDMCSSCMPQIRLRWHYRSHYEQLIAFSNKNFYDGDLVTFPSSKPDARGIGVDYYHDDGVFDRRSHTNRKEAEFIVDLIYKNIDEYPNRSLGVVAFSVAQQDLIDKLLSKRRQATPEKEYFFSQDAKEPFFIKNLETVQGDERDTIIFSVAYGVDASGNLLHNFGPLNRVGGERRLNVAVTRAKDNVQVVSSMRYTDIDLTRAKSEGARLLREYLDYAENGNLALERSTTVKPFEEFDSDFEKEVCDFLKSKGYSVDTQVGCSGYRIDLGLKRPGTSDYVLAIECDGATYHSSKNARDRDRLRQQILENMGWKFYRIWSTDWFKNRIVAEENLLQAASGALEGGDEAADMATEAASVDDFEVASTEQPFDFPPYVAADIESLKQKYLPMHFGKIVREIIELEAPINEDYLLKKVLWYFNCNRICDTARRMIGRYIYMCDDVAYRKGNGFIYLNGQSSFPFRKATDLQSRRNVDQIAPEELEDGMLKLIEKNFSVEKEGLYRLLAAQCGFSRVGSDMTATFDSTLNRLLGKGKVIREGDRISLKQ